MKYATEHQPSNSDEQYQEVKRRVFERWGIGPNDEPVVAAESPDGSPFEQLVAAVEDKTGVSRDQVEAYVESIRAEVVGKFHEARARIEPKLNELDHKARAVVADASASASAKYSEAESKVREKPMTALAVAFGVGIAAGLILGAGRRA